MRRNWSSGAAVVLWMSVGSFASVVMAGIQTEQTKLRASDGAADDNFGTSVSVAGDTAVFGAEGDDDLGSFSGAAYVFVASGGAWTEQAKLLASDGAEFAYFGASVSVAGNTAVVGADGDDELGRFTGAAYVFVRSGDSWAEQDKLLASDGAEFDHFGESVSVDGDTVVVGVEQRDDLGISSGAAYVFVRSGDVWTEQAKLMPIEGEENDRFGRSVSIDGNTIVVGAEGDDDVADGSGAAYVFVRDGELWTEQAKLRASDGAATDSLGRSVSIDGDTVVIGARKDGFQVRPGAAYVFVRSGEAWTEQAKLLASDGADQDFFARSVALAGDTVVVGASGVDDLGNRSGAAYLFGRDGEVWTELAKLLASDGEEDDELGESVSVSGAAAFVGAPGFGRFIATRNRGAVYVFGVYLFADGFESGDTSGWMMMLAGI